LRESLLMPRQRQPRGWDVVAGCRDWPLRGGGCRPGTVRGRGEHHRPRGIGDALPGRSSCVRNVVTPSGSGLWPGKPTVREAQLPGRDGMTEKRMPVAERQRETGASWLAPPARRPG
jgi:hypothetical protein